MADLDNILIFVKVAQYESISRAARSLSMPISTVSRRLSVLESQLGVALLRRTTRRVSLTPQGREYFNECQEPLSLLQEAQRVLTHSQQQPEGLLRITVPVVLSHDSFLQFLSGFLHAHSGIRVDLHITNTFLDLVAENIDVAVRFGDLQDSSLVAKRLGQNVRYVVAAPDFLTGREQPREPADLERHACVMLAAKNNETHWDLVSGRRKARVQVSGPVSTRDFNTVSTFVLHGHGIGLAPSFHCEEHIARGQLVRLLPKWTSPPIPVFAVYQSRKYLPLRLSVFLRALATWRSPLWIKDST
jgi:DNA-binding transcriptional LysR family regulator